MTLYRYDEPALLRQLAVFLPGHRGAFAAACAQRLLPAYESFAKATVPENFAKLKVILGRLWHDLGEDEIAANELTAIIDGCMALVPPPEDEIAVWEPAYALAENAAAAVAYALRCRLSGDPQEAAWAGGQAYEAVDLFAHSRFNLQFTDPDAEERILAHPVVQQELSRQRRDLRDLADASSAESLETFRRLRQKAEHEATSMFAAIPETGP